MNKLIWARLLFSSRLGVSLKTSKFTSMCFSHFSLYIFFIQIDDMAFSLFHSFEHCDQPRQTLCISKYILLRVCSDLIGRLCNSNLIVDRMIETIWSKLTGDPLRQVRACVWLPNFVGTAATTLPPQPTNQRPNWINWKAMSWKISQTKPLPFAMHHSLSQLNIF